MKIDSKDVSHIQTRLLENLVPLRAGTVHTPHAGWIRATRDALAMSRVQLAARLGVTRARISQIEAGEVDGAIKLDTLQRVAEAMHCQLVYAFVPDDDYDVVIRHQATGIARERVDAVVHTMNLEDQAPSGAGRQRLLEDEIDSLVATGELWDQ